MRAVPRVLGVSFLLVVALASGGAAVGQTQDPRSGAWLGACYCRAPGTLVCTANVTERDCRRRCDEALFDDWLWRERLPCWNWGYGG